MTLDLFVRILASAHDPMLSLAYLEGAFPVHAPQRSEFFRFAIQNFSKRNCLGSPRPTYGKSWIRHWLLIKIPISCMEMFSPCAQRLSGAQGENISMQLIGQLGEFFSFEVSPNTCIDVFHFITTKCI